MTKNTAIRVLAGDIGGTKTRLALFDVDGTALRTIAEERYASQEYPAFPDLTSQFLAEHPCQCDAACFGVAGPVRDGKARTTNLPWRLVATDLAQSMGIRQVTLLNDLEANAWGIRALGQDDFFVLHEGEADPGGNAAIIAAGTGLGEAGMYRDGARLCPFGTEGGHCDFAPGDEVEIELLRYLMRQYSHVSWERILSGAGLVNLYNFLCEYRKSVVPGWLAESMQAGDPAAAISRAALEGKDDTCVEALDRFVYLYGVEAGNLALKMFATGGFFIGGGIAPKIVAKLEDGTFMRGFQSKGRMESLLSSMPVRVILNDKTALYGPAVFAARDVHAPG